MKIALVRLSALGDIIQSAMVLQFIKKFQPKASIHFFVDSRFKELLKNHPLIDKIYALPLKDKKIFALIKTLFSLRKEKYDIIIDMQGLIKSALISRLLGVNIFGFDKESLKEGFAASFYNQKFHCNYNENVYYRYLALICFVFNESFTQNDIALKEPVFRADESILASLKTRLESLFENLKNNDKTAAHLSLENDKTAARHLQSVAHLKTLEGSKDLNLKPEISNEISNENPKDENFKLILIHPHASVANKIYPKERLAILLTLIARYDESLKIALSWGSKKERAFNEEVLALCGAQNALCLPHLSLQELIALTQLSTLVIGNDSGPTHLAFAMNKPSITIFGATSSKRNAFITPINKTIDAGKKFTDAKHIDKSDFCIQNVDEDAIFTLVKELLE